MSLIYAVFSLKNKISDEEAGELYDKLSDPFDEEHSGSHSDACCTIESEMLVPSKSIDDFYKELTERYPEEDPETGFEYDDCPWSEDIIRSTSYILMGCRTSHADAIAFEKFLCELTDKYSLALYLADSGEILYPDNVVPEDIGSYKDEAYHEQRTTENKNWHYYFKRIGTILFFLYCIKYLVQYVNVR